MTVIAGPPEGGKSTGFNRNYFQRLDIPYFNIDDRCKTLHGSSTQIPEHIRRKANAELRAFSTDHITRNLSFAFETTLRAEFAIERAAYARQCGVDTLMHFLAADEDTHVRRVTGRAEAGGHAASPPRLRDMYRASMANLPKAMAAFDECRVYDTSTRATLQLVTERGNPLLTRAPLAAWFHEPLAAFHQLTERQLEQGRGDFGR